ELKKATDPLLIRRLLVVAENATSDASAKEAAVATAQKHLDAEDEDLARVALGVVTRHPNADESVAPSLAAWLTKGEVSAPRLNALRGFCHAFLGKPNTAGLVSTMLNSASRDTRQAAWQILSAQSTG